MMRFTCGGKPVTHTPADRRKQSNRDRPPYAYPGRVAFPTPPKPKAPAPEPAPGPQEK